MCSSHVLSRGLWTVARLLLALACWSASAAPQPTGGSLAAQDASLNDLQHYAAPTDQVLPDLRAGLRKLQRMCVAPSSGPDKGAEPALQGGLDVLRDQWALARNRLSDLQRQAQTVLQDYERQSRVGQMPWCQLSPGWLPVCSGYRSDQQLLTRAKELSARLFGEAQQRLAVYEQYAELEANRCTSRGFTRRLWLTEETYLWPLVTGAPAFLQRVLRAP